VTYRKCSVCNAEYTAYRPWAKYCSTRCALKGQRQRKNTELVDLKAMVAALEPKPK
jgi:hypothetical protein